MNIIINMQRNHASQIQQHKWTKLLSSTLCKCFPSFCVLTEAEYIKTYI